MQINQDFNEELASQVIGSIEPPLDISKEEYSMTQCCTFYCATQTWVCQGGCGR